MFLLSLLLAATISTTSPTTVKECQIIGTVQESAPTPAPSGAPERVSLKLVVNSVEEKCAGDFPKNEVASFFIAKNNIKAETDFKPGTRLETTVGYLLKDAGSVKLYKVVPPNSVGSVVPSAQSESFLTSIINAIKKLFGWK